MITFDIMNISNLICHRMPERSFFIKGHQFPVCARCTGGYLGIFLMNLIYFLIIMPYNYQMILLSFVLIIPSGIDGGTQFLGLRESNNVLRLITGLLLGFGIVILCKYIKHVLL